MEFWPRSSGESPPGSRPSPRRPVALERVHPVQVDVAEPAPPHVPLGAVAWRPDSAAGVVEELPEGRRPRHEDARPVRPARRRERGGRALAAVLSPAGVRLFSPSPRAAVIRLP